MRIYKFGGASVKNAESVKNLLKILSQESGDLMVVVSAMGKTTNALEQLTEAYFTKTSGKVFDLFSKIRDMHFRIFDQLMPRDSQEEKAELNALFTLLEERLEKTPSLNFDFEYDQIVPFGELFSTKIVALFLGASSVNCEWLDIRRILRTDDQYRAANIDWETSKSQLDTILPLNKMIVTQGFIGSTREGLSTTLGREGSDYTASVLANLTDAKEVIIWKDVPGIMNADPKQFPESEKMDTISYQEAVELAFYGAKVIHPKTIQPLQNKQIPLHVKSFLDPSTTGTIITNVDKDIDMLPVYILKENQILLSISIRDFSFVNERQISEIYGLLDEHRAHVSLSQNSAISYSLCIQCESRRLPDLIDDLKKRFKLLYNEGVELITIRHYTDECIDTLLKNKEVLLEQRSRRTARFVVREKRN